MLELADEDASDKLEDAVLEAVLVEKTSFELVSELTTYVPVFA
jgi:hypothetical protein